MFKFVDLSEPLTCSEARAGNHLGLDDKVIETSEEYPGHVDRSYLPRVKFMIVSLTHETGKSWESAYIQTTGSSMSGISITWWNRRRGLPGEILIKNCSEASWRKTADNKVQNGGYSVVSGAFDERGLLPSISSKSEHDDSGGFSFTYGYPKASAHDDQAKFFSIVVGALISASPQFRNFFTRLEHKGHGYKLMNSLSSGRFTSDVEVGKAISEVIGKFIKKEVRAAQAGGPVVVEPPPKVEERYDAWGAFG